MHERVRMVSVYRLGLFRFMGNGDLWGLIFTHKSEWGFMGMNGDLLIFTNKSEWGFMGMNGDL